MNIEKYNGLENDSRTDACGNRTVAVLVGDAFRLCLCRDCLASLTNEAEAVKHELERSCSRCRHYLEHPDGYDYCGRCGLTESGKHYYNGSKGWLDSCDNFEEKT